jgi:DNA-directed RNA polymerase subunit RPC12/RpoP
MSSSNYSPFNVRAKTRQVVNHHYDEEKPGKPLYLLFPGGLIALASLALIIFIAYRTWLVGSLTQSSGLTLILVLAPIYIGGVFLFSYGYELYNVPKSLRLTAFIVFITLAAVVILAVLFLTLGSMGDRESRSSGSSQRSSSSSSSRGRGPGLGLWPIFLGGLGFPGQTQTVTREVIHEVPTEPPPPQPIQCPYCGSSYVPAQTNYACPNCGATSPEDAPSRDAGST